MRLRQLELRHYRGFNGKTLTIAPDVTVLVGPNDRGKSNILKALRCYRSPSELSDESDKTLGAPAEEEMQVRTVWSVPQGKPTIRSEVKKVLGNGTEASELALCTSAEACRAWGGSTTEDASSNMPEDQAGQLLLTPVCLDASDTSRSARVPHIVPSLDALSTDEYSVIRQLIEVSGADVATLRGYRDSARQDRELRHIGEQISGLLRSVYVDFPDLHLGLNKEKQLFVEFMGADGHRFPPAERGLGLRLLLRLVLDLQSAAKQSQRERRPLILIDEPETGLHPGAQRQIQQFIWGLALEHGHQVVVATHSPFMIDPNRLHQVRLVDKEGEACVIKNKCYRRLHEEPIQTALQLPMGTTLFMATRNVLVEGGDDQTLMVALSQACAALDLDHLDLIAMSIIPLEGVGENLMGRLKATTVKRGAAIVSVFDNDQAGRDQVKKARGAGVEWLFVDLSNPSVPAAQRTKFETEDLLPVNVYKMALVNNYRWVHQKAGASAPRLSPAEFAAAVDAWDAPKPIADSACAFVKSTFPDGSFKYRKEAVNEEAAWLVMEGMPAIDGDGSAEEGLYAKADLKPAALLFADLNRVLAGESVENVVDRRESARAVEASRALSKGLSDLRKTVRDECNQAGSAINESHAQHERQSTFGLPLHVNEVIELLRKVKSRTEDRWAVRVREPAENMLRGLGVTKLGETEPGGSDLQDQVDGVRVEAKGWLVRLAMRVADELDAIGVSDESRDRFNEEFAMVWDNTPHPPDSLSLWREEPSTDD